MPTKERRKKVPITMGLMFALLGGLLVVMLMASVSLIVIPFHIHALEKQVKIKGAVIVASLAERAVPAMLTDDPLLLADLVDEVPYQSLGVAYVALVNSGGIILAHSDFQQDGKRYLLPEAVSKETVGRARVVRFSKKGEQYIDVSAAIKRDEQDRGKGLGRVHIAIALAGIRLQTQALLYKLVILTGCGVFAMAILSLLLAWTLSSSVRRMKEGIEQFGSGNFSAQLKLFAWPELLGLVKSLNQMAVRLKQSQKELVKQEYRARDRDLARTMQEMLVPKSLPRIPGWSLGMLYRPSHKVSADYVDFIELSRGCWAVAVADVSRKGVTGGIAMLQVSAMLRSLAQEVHSPSAVLSKLDYQLGRHLSKGVFVTLSYAFLDPHRRQLTLARAGHPAAIIYRKQTDHCEIEMPGGLAVGLSSHAVFDEVLTEKKIKLNPGDFVLLYTNGLDKAYNADQELFGLERLCACAQKAARYPAQKIIDKIEATAMEFAAGLSQADDMALILVKAEEERKA